MPSLPSRIPVRARIGIGLRAGLIAAAATGGALVGFGIVRGATLRPLNAIAHLVLGSRALLFEGFDPIVTSAGIALHVLSILLVSVLFVLLAARLPSAALWLVALLLSAVMLLANLSLLPESLRPGFERVLTTAEVASVYLLLAISLALALQLLRERDDLRRARDTGWLQNATTSGDRRSDPAR